MCCTIDQKKLKQNQDAVTWLENVVKRIIAYFRKQDSTKAETA